MPRQYHVNSYEEFDRAIMDVPDDLSIEIVVEAINFPQIYGFRLTEINRHFRNTQTIIFKDGSKFGPIYMGDCSNFELVGPSIFHGDPKTGYTPEQIRAGKNEALIVCSSGSSDITIDKAEVHSTDFRDCIKNKTFSKPGYGYTNEIMGLGVSLKGTRCTITDSLIHDVARGVFLGGDGCGYSNCTIQDVYTNFSTWGSAGANMFCLDNIQLGVWGSPYDNTTGITSRDPHTSTGLSGDPSGGRTMDSPLMAGNISDGAFWRRIEAHRSLGLPDPKPSHTGSKFNDPNSVSSGYPGNGKDTYKNVQMVYNLQITGNIGHMVAGSDGAFIYGNVAVRDPYGSGTPGFYFDSVNDLVIDKNVAPYRNKTYEFDGSEDYYKTEDTVESFENYWIENDEILSQFKGHPTKGFRKLEASDYKIAFELKEGSWMNSSGHGGPMSPNYLGGGLIKTIQSISEPTGESYGYPRGIYDGTRRESHAYPVVKETSAIGYFLASSTCTDDSTSRDVFDSQGNTFELTRLSTGRYQLYLKDHGDTVPLLKFLTSKSYPVGTRVDMACEWDMNTGIVRVVVNGTPDGYLIGSDWDISTGLPTGNMKRIYVGGSYIGSPSTNKRPWIGEIGLLAFHSGNLLGLDSSEGINKIFGADGQFKELTGIYPDMVLIPNVGPLVAITEPEPPVKPDPIVPPVETSFPYELGPFPEGTYSVNVKVGTVDLNIGELGFTDSDKVYLKLSKKV